MLITTRGSVAYRKVSRFGAIRAVLTLCLAAVLFAASPDRAAASDELRIATNLWDILRGSQDSDEEDAKQNEAPAPEKTTETDQPQPAKPKKRRAATADPKQVDPGATRLVVVGDSLAQDLWFGVQRAFRNSKHIEVIRFTKSASGLVRDDSYNWNKKLGSFVAEQDFDIAVVVFGGNDRQEIRLKGKRLPRFSKVWAEEYRNRVAHIITLLKTRAEKVFWVSLPVVRSERMTRDYLKLNKIYKAEAEANGAEYVDIWSQFRGEDGGYTSFGPDLQGAKRRLRQDDGLHFTLPGQGRFADEVLKIMRKTIQLSSLERPAYRAEHRFAQSAPAPTGD